MAVGAFDASGVEKSRIGEIGIFKAVDVGDNKKEEVADTINTSWALSPSS